MFDHVATVTPPHPRQAVALLVAHLAVASALLALAVLSAAPLAAALVPPEPIEVPVELRAPPAPSGGAPAPRVARPRRAAPAAAPVVPPAVTPPPALTTPADAALAVTPIAPSGDGPDGPGTAGGGGTGPGTGLGGASGPGAGAGGVRAIDGGAVRVRTQRQPDYPEAARALGIEEAVCTVRIAIDPRGVPSEVTPVACPPAFVDPTVEAAMKWRFYPVRVEGQAVAARFVLRVRYQLR